MNNVGILVQSEVVLLYLAYLLIPGYFVTVVAGLWKNRLVLSFAISFTILVISQIPYRLIGGPILVWYAFLHGTIVIAFAGAVVSHRKKRYVDIYRLKSRGKYERIGLAIVVIGFTIYHLGAGPYAEIPSDFWVHLGAVVEEIHQIDGGRSLEGVTLGTVLKSTTFVHFLHAVVAQLTEVHPLLIIREATLIASLVFLMVFYCFTLRIMEGLKMTDQARVAAAVLATGLMVVSYGVATFSYIRYYAYFPHILNMALVFSSVLLVIGYLERPEKKWLGFGWAVVLVGIMVLVNRQEAVFALTFIVGISMMRLLRTYSLSREISAQVFYRNRVAGYGFLTLLVLGIFLTVLLREPGKWVYPSLIDLGPYLRIDWQVLIANPSMRFWDTLAPYGFIVYLWYIVRLKWFRGADYIHVGMLSPLLTLLNPLFVWWFLHVASWDPLWRMALLMPLPIVGAVLIVKSFTGERLVVHSPKIWGACILSLILLASLLPWDNSLFRNTRSRASSLAFLSKTNGEQLWWDLINAVDRLDGERQLVTDPVTQYVLSSSTMHRMKFPGKAGWQRDRDAFSGDYKDRLLYYGMDGSIVIINERDGLPSRNGAWSGHWPEDILTVSVKYPEDLKTFLETEKTEFQQVWAGDSIVAYEVLRNPNDY